VTGLDHLALTVADVERTVAFYERVLGMEPVTFGQGRRALAFGDNKINLHQAGNEFRPHAAKPTPGSADLCLVTEVPQRRVVEHLAACGVAQVGAGHRPSSAGSRDGPLLHGDPDGNLIEVSTYGPDGEA